MANHVSTYVQFLNLDEKGVKFLEERFAFFTGDNRGEGVHHVFPDFETDSDGDVSRSVYYDRIGAKWCYVEDFMSDDDSASVMLLSAWCHPRELVEWLVENLYEVCPDSKVFVSYEDEMPNFYGCEVYVEGVSVDGMESEDTEEIDLDLCHYDSDFKEVYDLLQEVNEETDEDKYEELENRCCDLRNELIWEMIGEQQTRVFNEY
jgi:hypothetical protein